MISRDVGGTLEVAVTNSTLEYILALGGELRVASTVRALASGRGGVLHFLSRDFSYSDSRIALCTCCEFGHLRVSSAHVSRSSLYHFIVSFRIPEGV